MRVNPLLCTLGGLSPSLSSSPREGKLSATGTGQNIAMPDLAEEVLRLTEVFLGK